MRGQMSRPGIATIKTLFAHSCNRCAFPGCDQRLTDRPWSGVRADIAHIRGEKPGAARYAPDMTDAERNGIDNLMLLCPNHHREIDRLSPQEWPPDRLMEVKARHEAGCENREWASDAQLEFFSSLLASADGESVTPLSTERARLVLERATGDTFEVVNVGEGDAFRVRVGATPESIQDRRGMAGRRDG
jgi:hypothetical protein